MASSSTIRRSILPLFMSSLCRLPSPSLGALPSSPSLGALPSSPSLGALPSSPSLDLLPLTSSVDPPVISPPRVRSDRRQARSLIEASMTRHVKRLRLAVAADRLAAADQHDAGVGPEESQVIAADCRGSPLSPKRHRWSAADSH